MKKQEKGKENFDEILKLEEKNLIDTKYHHGQSLNIIKGYYKGKVATICDFRYIEKDNPMQSRTTMQLPKLKLIYYQLKVVNSKQEFDYELIWLPEDYLKKTLF
jgi:predicted choloylglycine hydrolase